VLIDQFRTQKRDAPPLPDESRSAGQATGPCCFQILHFHFDGGSRAIGLTQQMSHRNIKCKSRDTAVNAALGIKHELLHIKGDDAFVGGVGQFKPEQPREEKLAEILLIGGNSVFEGGASLGFMLPVSTPCNAIVYGSGYIPLTRMIRYGILLDIAGVIVVVGMLSFVLPKDWTKRNLPDATTKPTPTVTAPSGNGYDK